MGNSRQAFERSLLLDRVAARSPAERKSTAVVATEGPKNAKKAFERALLVERVAGEFTEKEWEAHKKEHPGANRADHTITKGDKKPSKDEDYVPPAKRLSDADYDKLHKELTEELPKDHPDRAKKLKEYHDEGDARAQDKYKKRDERAKKDKEEDEKYWAAAKPKMQKLLKDHGFDPEDVDKVSEQNPEWLRNRMRELREDGSSPRLEEYGLKKLKGKK